MHACNALWSNPFSIICQEHSLFSPVGLPPTFTCCFFLSPRSPLTALCLNMGVWGFARVWVASPGLILEQNWLPSPSSHQLPMVPQLGVWLHEPPSASMTGFHLAPYYACLGHTVILAWVHINNCPVSPNKHHSPLPLPFIIFLYPFLWWSLSSGERDVVWLSHLQLSISCLFWMLTRTLY